MRPRIVCMWFPHLSVERYERQWRKRLVRPKERDTASTQIAEGDPFRGPFVLVQENHNALRLCSLNETARSYGLQPDMNLADARALCPGLKSAPMNNAADVQLLKKIHRWAFRYSPKVAMDRQGMRVFVDVAGASHLHNGEDKLIADAKRRLEESGLTVRLAIAETPTAARALASHGPNLQIAPAEALASTLRPLPIRALFNDMNVIQGLEQMGVRTIDDIMRVPRAPLARRFGLEAALILGRALGDIADPLNYTSPPGIHRCHINLPEPIERMEELMGVIGVLVEKLCQGLIEKHMAARRLALECVESHHRIQEVAIGLAWPSTSKTHMLGLIASKIEKITLESGVEAIELRASEVESLPPWQSGFEEQSTPDISPTNKKTSATVLNFQTSQNERTTLAQVLDRLAQRLGDGRLIRFMPAQSHIPERAYISVSAASDMGVDGNWCPPYEHRPLTLLSPQPIKPRQKAQYRAYEQQSEQPDSLVSPEKDRTLSGQNFPPCQFLWDKKLYNVNIARGPERIAPEWWLDDPNWRSGVRDYWLVETREGPRLWLFTVGADREVVKNSDMDEDGGQHTNIGLDSNQMDSENKNSGKSMDAGSGSSNDNDANRQKSSAEWFIQGIFP